jgi:hypothetical protein
MEFSWFSYMCGANSTHLQGIASACPLLSTLCSANMEGFLDPFFPSYSPWRTIAMRFIGTVKISKTSLTLLQLVTMLPVLVFMLHFLQNCKRRTMWARENDLATNSVVPVNLCALHPYIHSRNIFEVLLLRCYEIGICRRKHKTVSTVGPQHESREIMFVLHLQVRMQSLDTRVVKSTREFDLHFRVTCLFRINLMFQSIPLCRL